MAWRSWSVTTHFNYFYFNLLDNSVGGSWTLAKHTKLCMVWQPNIRNMLWAFGRGASPPEPPPGALPLDPAVPLPPNPGNTTGRFSCFCRSWLTERQTDRRTDGQTGVAYIETTLRQETCSNASWEAKRACVRASLSWHVRAGAAATTFSNQQLEAISRHMTDCGA